MVSPALLELMKPQLLTLRIIWAALTVSIPLYVFVAWWLAHRPGPDVPLPPAMVWAFALGAVPLVMASFLLPRALLSAERLRAVMAAPAPSPEPGRDPRTGRPDARRARLLAQVSARERSLLQLGRVAPTPVLIRLVLNEAVALFGFVLSVLSRDFAPAVPFAAVALALNLAAWPRFEPLLERARTLLPAG